MTKLDTETRDELRLHVDHMRNNAWGPEERDLYDCILWAIDDSEKCEELEIKNHQLRIDAERVAKHAYDATNEHMDALKRVTHLETELDAWARHLDFEGQPITSGDLRAVLNSGSTTGLIVETRPSNVSPGKAAKLTVARRPSCRKPISFSRTWTSTLIGSRSTMVMSSVPWPTN